MMTLSHRLPITEENVLEHCSTRRECGTSWSRTQKIKWVRRHRSMCLFKTYSLAFSTLFFCPRKLVFTGTVLMTHTALVIKKLPCFLASRFIQQRGATAGDWEEEEQHLLGICSRDCLLQGGLCHCSHYSRINNSVDPGATSSSSFPWSCGNSYSSSLLPLLLHSPDGFLHPDYTPLYLYWVLF